MRHLQGDHDGSRLRIGVVVSRFNESVTEALLKGALEGLDEAKVPTDAVTIASVPGAFELAGTAGRLAASGAVDAVVCIGAVIRGQTDHFTFVAAAAQEGILRVSIDTGIPIIFGVLTTDTVMKNMVVRLGLDRKYGTEVYSPRVADVSRLRQALSAVS